MKNYVQPGNVLTLIAPAALLSGDGVLVGSIFGIAATNAAQNEEVEAQVVGVFDLKKTSAQAWTVGAPIYWDNTAKEATTADGAGANKLIGVAVAAAANPSATGRVRLNGYFTA